MSTPALGYALVAFAAASWGLWPLILRYAEGFGPVDATVWSAALMGVSTLATVPSLARFEVTAAHRAKLRYVALLGVSNAANAWFFFQAYRTTSVALAICTHYLAPILVSLFAPFVNGEARHPRAVASAFIGFGGLLLILNPWSAVLDRAALLGSAFGVASAFAYAANVFLNRRIGDTFTGAQITCLHGVVATLLLLLLTSKSAWMNTSAATLGVVAASGLTLGAASGIAFIVGLRFIPTAHAAVLTFAEPVVALILGVTLLGESLSARACLGAIAVVCAGVYVVLPETAAARTKARSEI